MAALKTRDGRQVTVLDVLGQGGAFSRHLKGYEERPQQIQVASRIAAGLAPEMRRHVVAQAATGCGKSHAGMVPAALSGEKIVYSTAVKALQEQIADKDAPFLAGVLEQEFGKHLTYAVLKGRGNYVCLRNVERLEQSGEFRSPEAAAMFPKVLDWIEQERDNRGVADVETFAGMIPNDLRMDLVTSTDECTGERCPMYTKCFAEEAKERAAAADIIVVNHTLLLLDALIRGNTEGHATVLPDYSVLLLDECHQFEDKARDVAGIEVTEGRARRLVSLVDRLTTLHDEVQKQQTLNEITETAHTWSVRTSDVMKQFTTFLETLKARLQKNEDVREMRLGDERNTPIKVQNAEFQQQIALLGVTAVEEEIPTIGQVAEKMAQLGMDMEEGTPTYLTGEERDQWAKLASQTIKLAIDIRTTITPGQDDTWVRRAQLDGEDGRIRVVLDAKPVDVSPWLRETFFGGVRKVKVMKDKQGEVRPVSNMLPLVVVAMSATISVSGTMEMWRERVGCDDADEVIVGSPFDFEKNALLYLPDSPEELVPVQRNRPGYEEYVTALAAEMRGLTLDAQGGAFLLFTSRSMMNTMHARIAGDLEAAGLLVLRQGDANRGQLVTDFKASGRAVLFGMKTFWEGVDIPGDALRLVAIDKVPFNPPTDVLWSALCEYIDRRAAARGEGDRASFRKLVLPTAIIALMQGVGRLIRSKTDRGVFALLDGRVRTKARGYGNQILKNMPSAAITSDPRQVRAMFQAILMGQQGPVRPVRIQSPAADLRTIPPQRPQQRGTVQVSSERVAVATAPAPRPATRFRRLSRPV